MITNKEKIYFYIHEALFTFSFALFGVATAQKYILHAVIFALYGIYSYGLVSLYIGKYNIKPFFYNWLPQKIKDHFSKEVRV